MHSVAIFGGTFDPVHNGHIKTSLAIQDYFNFDTYCFLPCKTPTIKPPTLANTQQRIEMLQLAIKPYPQFTLDLREIVRDTPSYMVDTLESFREEHKNIAITLILGYDAFLSLSQWHQWERIIKLANLLIINRDQYAYRQVPDSIKKLLQNSKTNFPSSLLTEQAGAIYFFNAGNYDISSTEIRQELKDNNNVAAKLPEDVYDYIKKHVRDYFGK